MNANPFKRAFTTSRPLLAKVPTQNLREIKAAPRFPVIPTCPAPTCVCRPMPDLDIDPRPFDRSVAPYTEHVLIHTGWADWPSRIENDERNTTARELRDLFRPKSKYHDPYNRALVSNSAFKASTESGSSTRSMSLLKRGLHINYPSDLPTSSLVDEYLSGKREGSPTTQIKTSPIPEVMVLICGHSSRDMRCGVMGPLLQSEFIEKFSMSGYEVLHEPPGEMTAPGAGSNSNEKTGLGARIGLISHVGGHAFAGNVIIYVPRTFQTHPLAGLGVWYGRVEPRHVEGIVQQTVLGGKVIQELLRGTV